MNLTILTTLSAFVLSWVFAFYSELETARSLGFRFGVNLSNRIAGSGINRVWRWLVETYLIRQLRVSASATAAFLEGLGVDPNQPIDSTQLRALKRKIDYEYTGLELIDEIGDLGEISETVPIDETDDDDGVLVEGETLSDHDVDEELSPEKFEENPSGDSIFVENRLEFDPADSPDELNLFIESPSSSPADAAPRFTLTEVVDHLDHLNHLEPSTRLESPDDSEEVSFEQRDGVIYINPKKIKA